MRARGVTLLELLVVLVLVGIVAALALPSYQRYLQRVHRTEATTALYQIVSAQESHHLRHGVFAADIAAPPPGGLGLSETTEGGRYAITIDLATDAQSFIATATPLGDASQAGDAECLAFSLDHRGQRGISGRGEVARCWR
jgi:type IV pilus assembly protein PilE